MFGWEEELWDSLGGTALTVIKSPRLQIGAKGDKRYKASSTRLDAEFYVGQLNSYLAPVAQIAPFGK